MRRLRKLHFAVSPSLLGAHLCQPSDWGTIYSEQQRQVVCLKWKKAIICLHLDTVNMCVMPSPNSRPSSPHYWLPFPEICPPSGPPAGSGDSEAGRTGGQLDAVDQSPGFGERQSRKKIPASLQVLSKGLQLCEPPLPHLKNRDMTICLTCGSFIHSVNTC